MSVQKRTNFLSKLRFAKLELELVSSLRLGLVRDWDKSIQYFIFNISYSLLVQIELNGPILSIEMPPALAGGISIW